MRTIIATAPIAAIVIMGRTGAKPEYIIAAVVAFVLAVLLANPLDLLDVLPARFRQCIAAAIVGISLAIALPVSASARAGLIVAAAVVVMVAIKRRQAWHAAELIRQSPAADNVLSGTATAAVHSWDGHGKAETRALMHQGANIELTEADIERLCAPVYALGYVHGISGNARLLKKVRQLERERVDSLCRIAALEADERNYTAIREELETTRAELDALKSETPEPVRIVMHHAPPPPVPRDPTEREPEPEPTPPEEAEDKQTRNARIIAARGAGASLGELAARFGMSRSGIQHILRG